MIIENKLLLEKLIIKPNFKMDLRGWFYRQLDIRDIVNKLEEDLTFVNVNRSYNDFSHTLRGMHLQKEPMEEVKVVSCLHGKIQDVIVDMNRNSPTYLNYVTCTLSSENRWQLIVPKGFAHGYLTLEDKTEVQYVTTQFYSPLHEIVFDSLSPMLEKIWYPGHYTRSEKDKNGELII